MFASRSVLVLCQRRAARRAGRQAVCWFATDSDKKSDETESDVTAALDESWIPPNRPLSGTSTPFLSQELKPITEIMEPTEDELSGYDSDDDDEEDDEDFEEWMMLQELEEEQEATDINQDFNEQIDWLQTRRSKLGMNLMTTPADGSRVKLEQSELSVVEHTLLSRNEIITCLENLGGTDITCISDDHNIMGGGVEGMVLVTALSASHICTMADAIVVNLKRRKLHKMGVVAAQFGSEAASKEDTWQVVDCRNFIIHFMDEKTRNHLQLEKLWSGKDSIKKVNPLKEEDWDDYVEANPVPDDFYAFTSNRQQGWTETVAQLQRSNNKWEPPSFLKTKPKRKGKRRKNRKRTA